MKETDGLIDVKDIVTEETGTAFGAYSGTIYLIANVHPHAVAKLYCPLHRRIFDRTGDCPECEKGGEE